MIRLIISLMLVTAFTQSKNVHAGEYDVFTFDIDLPRYHAISKDAYQVEIDDQVTDGCWTSTESSKNAVALELKRSNRLASEETLFSASIVLHALGYQLNDNSCAVYYRLDLRYPDFGTFTRDGNELTTFFYNSFSFGSGISTGPKNSMSSRLKENFLSLTQRFLLEDADFIVNRMKEDPEITPENLSYWKEQLRF